MVVRMTEKKFDFKSFEISKTERFLNEVKLYEIDINHSDELDESNLFYVYSDSEANIIQIVEKLNELNNENTELNSENTNLIIDNKELKCTNVELAKKNERLKEENKKLREQLKDCTKKAKEEIRKQAENDAIRWANIGR